MLPPPHKPGKPSSGASGYRSRYNREQDTGEQSPGACRTFNCPEGQRGPAAAGSRQETQNPPQEMGSPDTEKAAKATYTHAGRVVGRAAGMQAAPTQGRCLLSPSWPRRSPLHRLDQAGAPAAPRAELAMGTPADANVCIYRHLHFCWHCSSHGDRQLCAVRPVDNLPVAAVTMFSSPQSQTRWALLGRAAFMRGLTPKKQSRKQPKAGVSKPLPPPRAARHPLPRQSSHFAATAPQATHGAVKRRVPVRSHQAQLGHVPSPGVPPPQAHTHIPHSQGQHCLSPEPPGRLPRGRLAQPQRR